MEHAWLRGMLPIKNPSTQSDYPGHDVDGCKLDWRGARDFPFDVFSQNGKAGKGTIQLSNEHEIEIPFGECRATLVSTRLIVR